MSTIRRPYCEPRFTACAMEMSFVQREDVIQVVEGMMVLLFKELKGIELKRPFTKLTYAEAMNRFGSDKPDMRFGLELKDFTEALRNSQARVFASAIKSGGVVKGIRIPKGAELSRKDLDDMAIVGFDADALITWHHPAQVRNAETTFPVVCHFFGDWTDARID